MSAFVLMNQNLYLDSYDITGRMNAVAMALSSDAKDVTCFRDDTTKRIGGLLMIACQAEGYVEPDATDTAIFNDIGIADKPLSICSQGEAVGNVAHFFKAMMAKYATKGSVGEPYTFSLEAEASGSRLVKGNVLLNSRTAPITSTGHGTGLQLGAITTGKKLFAAVHILSGTGSMALKLVSDSSNAFSSTADVLDFGTITGAGSNFLSTAATSADDWYRMQYTISGMTPSFQAIVVMGIL